ncbi:MAG: type II secretion system F family protein [Eubacteriales bacterium]|nr:type II secretion system F family protein [Eubacteriales bacterium]
MIAYLFYESVIAFLLLTPVGVWRFLCWEEECIRKKQREFQEQFREAIQSISASMRAGYSVENAMKETKKDLSVLYNENIAIQRELTHMVRQIYLQIPMEQIMEEWADRVCQEDVRNFVNVFVMAKKSGGNMIGIIKSSTDQVRDKLEVRAEIETMLAARKYEFKVMSAIPFGMIGYMKISFPEFMDILYGNPLGIGVMSVCLAVYFGAYVLGERIVNIEV